MRRVLLLFAVCLIAVSSVLAQESVELKNAGNEALRTKDYATALASFEKAISVWGDQPIDYAMIYNAGVCAYQLKSFDKAIGFFDQAITGEYKPETAYQYKAYVYKAKQDTEAYINTLTEGIAKVADNAKLKEVLAKYYVSEGTKQYNAAAAILKSAADQVAAGKFKTTDDAYKNEAAKAKKAFGEAVSIVSKALEVNPADETAKKIKAACESSMSAL